MNHLERRIIDDEESEDLQPKRGKRRRRHAQKLSVNVRVFEVEHDIEIRHFPKVDFAKRSNRDWLFGMIVWATNNGKAVEIVHAKDDDE